MTNKNRPFSKGDQVIAAKSIRSTAGDAVEPNQHFTVKVIRYIRKKKRWIVYLVGLAGSFLACYFVPARPVVSRPV